MASPRSVNITTSRRRLADEQEAFLGVGVGPVREDAPERIAERRHSLLKGDPVLRDVVPGFTRVPFEACTTFHLASSFTSRRAQRQCPKIQTRLAAIGP